MSSDERFGPRRKPIDIRQLLFLHDSEKKYKILEAVSFESTYNTGYTATQSLRVSECLSRYSALS